MDKFMRWLDQIEDLGWRILYIVVLVCYATIFTMFIVRGLL